MITLTFCGDDKTRLLLLGDQKRSPCTDGRFYSRSSSVTYYALGKGVYNFRYALGALAAEFSMSYQPTCCGMYHLYDLKLVGAPESVKDETAIAPLIESLHAFLMDDMSRNTVHTAVESGSLLEKYLVENGWKPVGPSILDKETGLNMQILFGYRSKIIGRDVRFK